MSGNEWQVTWKPTTSGVHAINIQVIGSAPDGTPIEREAFLSVQAQPSASQVAFSQQGLVIALVAVAVLTTLLIAILIIRRRRRKA